MIGLHRSYLMVAMAICGVCYFDEQFRADLVAGLKSYAGDSSKRLHFGLGNASKVDALDVTWPSGKTEIFSDVTINQVNIIKERRQD